MRVKALIGQGPYGWRGNDKDFGERNEEALRRQSMLKGHSQWAGLKVGGAEGRHLDAPDVYRLSGCRLFMQA